MKLYCAHPNLSPYKGKINSEGYWFTLCKLCGASWRHESDYPKVVIAMTEDELKEAQDE